MSGRLARGKSYADTGKVKELDVNDGRATAKEWSLTGSPADGYVPLADRETYPFPESGENYTGLVSALLPKETTFSEGGFAAPLIGLYHGMTRSEYGAAEEAGESVMRRFSGARYRVVPAKGRWTESVPMLPPRIMTAFASGETRELGLVEAADLFLRFSDDSGTTEYTYLFNLFRLFAAFRRSGAFAPAPLLSGESLSVVWRPLRYLREVKELLQSYTRLFPPGLMPTGKGPIPSRASLVEHLASSCITTWVHAFSSGLKAERADRREAFGLFFAGKSVDVSQPGKRSMPRALASYLAPLSVDFSRCTFRFTLGYRSAKRERAEEAGSAAFNLALDYLQRGEAGEIKPIPLMEASRKRINLEEGRVANFLSEAGPVLRRMGAEVVLPKALRRDMKPRLAVKVEVEGAKTLKSYLGLDEILNYDRRSRPSSRGGEIPGTPGPPRPSAGPIVRGRGLFRRRGGSCRLPISRA
jgi:hypothetical protein